MAKKEGTEIKSNSSISNLKEGKLYDSGKEEGKTVQKFQVLGRIAYARKR